jgi:hypothetical protein
MSKQSATITGTGGAEGFDPDAYKEKLENTSQGQMLGEFADMQAEKFLTALEAGKLPCQPGKEGFSDTYPSRNVIWGNLHHGITQIMLKLEQREKDYIYPDFLTMEAAQKAYAYARKDKPEVPLLRKEDSGEPVFILVPSGGMPGFQKLYNIEQFNDPYAIREYAAHLEKDSQDKKKADMERTGKHFYPNKHREPNSNGVIVCKSAEPAAFIGQWEAALSFGKKFKVTPEQNAAFTRACSDLIKESPNQANALSKLMRESSAYCQDFMRNFYRKQEAPAQSMAAPEPEMGR